MRRWIGPNPRSKASCGARLRPRRRCWAGTARASRQRGCEPVRSLVAIGGAYDALTGLVLLAVPERGETSGFAVFAPGRAGMFAILGRRQRPAHLRPYLGDYLAACSAAFADRHIFGPLRRRLVPAHAVFAGAAIPGDRT